MFGALIGALASVVGGNKARRDERKAIREQNEYNAPVNVRARAEAAGFNPLLFVGPGVGQQNVTGGSNYMGSAIASAGLALADGMDKAKMLEIERSRLAMEREKLDTLVQNAMIRPRSGGIYAGNVSAPSAGGVGGSGVKVNAQGSGNPARGASADIPLGNIPTPASYLDAGTGLFVNGLYLEAPPGYSNGNAIENEVGESVPGELMNWNYAAAFAGHNSGRLLKYWRQQQRAYMLAHPEKFSSGFSLDTRRGDAAFKKPQRQSDIAKMLARVPERPSKKLPDNYWQWPTREAWPKFKLGY